MESTKASAREHAQEKGRREEEGHKSAQPDGDNYCKLHKVIKCHKAVITARHMQAILSV